MSLRPTAIAESPLGMYVVIDDPDTEGVLMIPASFGHRRVVSREEYETNFNPIHPARNQNLLDALKEADSYLASIEGGPRKVTSDQELATEGRERIREMLEAETLEDEDP